MTQHTPGPWIFQNYKIRNSPPVIGTQQGRVLCVMHTNDDADGRLIAAAPELLQALLELLPTLEDQRIAASARAARCVPWRRRISKNSTRS